MFDNQFGIKRKPLVNIKDKIKEKELSTNSGEVLLWSTEKINKWLENKRLGLKNTGHSPFHEDNIHLRKANINSFEYTQDELDEIEKCARDVEYFADKYCYAMTDDGVQKIKLYDFQKETLKCFQNNRNIIYVASRQVGKCFFSLSTAEVNNAKTTLLKLYIDNTKLTFLGKIKNFLYKLLGQIDI